MVRKGPIAAITAFAGLVAVGGVLKDDPRFAEFSPVAAEAMDDTYDAVEGVVGEVVDVGREAVEDVRMPDFELPDVQLPDAGEVRDAISDFSGDAADVISDIYQTVRFGPRGEVAEQFLAVGGPEGNSSIMGDARAATSALNAVDMQEGDLFIAFVDTDGKIYIYDYEDPVLQTSYDGYLKMEDRYRVAGRPELSHVATRHITEGEDRVYVPWDVSYDVPQVREAGARFLQDQLNIAYGTLSQIDSVAYPGRKVADVITPEFLVNFLMTENISHENIDDRDLAITRHNSVLINFALNGDSTYSYRLSGAPAGGPMQITSYMYPRVRDAYDLNVPEDFIEGVRHIPSSFIVAACLLDDMARTLRYNDIIDADSPEDMSEDDYASLVGSYLMGAGNYSDGYRDSTSRNYEAKYRAMQRLHRR